MNVSTDDGHSAGGAAVDAGSAKADLYYDPFDFDIDDDPYPVWKRLREEAPLYYNEKMKFFALSRFSDVSQELGTRAKRRSFERIRENLHGIQVIGFDELFDRARGVLRLLRGQDDADPA